MEGRGYRHEDFERWGCTQSADGCPAISCHMFLISADWFGNLWNLTAMKCSQNVIFAEVALWQSNMDSHCFDLPGSSKQLSCTRRNRMSCCCIVVVFLLTQMVIDGNGALQTSTSSSQTQKTSSQTCIFQMSEAASTILWPSKRHRRVWNPMSWQPWALCLGRSTESGRCFFFNFGDVLNTFPRCEPWSWNYVPTKLGHFGDKCS